MSGNNTKHWAWIISPELTRVGTLRICPREDGSQNDVIGFIWLARGTRTVVELAGSVARGRGGRGGKVVISIRNAETLLPSRSARASHVAKSMT